MATWSPIFRENPGDEPRLNRKHLERILDLAEMIEAHEAGEKVTRHFYSTRIRPGCSDPWTYMRRAFDLALELGHQIDMVPDPEDEGAAWVVSFADLPSLRSDVALWLRRLHRPRKHSAAHIRRIRERRDELVDRGLCIECAEDPAQDGRLKCRSCRALDSGRAIARRDELRSFGLCEKCGDERALPGRTFGERCTRTRSEHQARYRAERIASGLCARCGQSPAEQGRLCRPCYEHEQQRWRSPRRRELVETERERRRREGLCVWCGAPAAVRRGKVMSLCAGDLAYAAKKRAEYVARKKRREQGG